MTTSGEAMTFLNMARKYQKAGSRLLDSIEGDKADPQRALSDPMYFLFAHTLELAFKAFLLFRGEDIPMSGKAGHDIVALHRQCAALGLRLKEDAESLPRVVEMLATENEHHGFRYFDPVKGNNGIIPALPWTCDVVNALIAVIREQLGDTTPDGPVKVQFIVVKPTTRDS
jgi:hypothetical protein